jgi:hypothetical protein
MKTLIYVKDELSEVKGSNYDMIVILLILYSYSAYTLATLLINMVTLATLLI